MASIPSALRQAVGARARHRCEYCHSPESLTGGPLHVEHVLPEVRGGPTTLDNLALACARCNLHKGTRTQHRDPVSGSLLYNTSGRDSTKALHCHQEKPYAHSATPLFR
jgi:5-methylcytosine-specific restriction endonuclease McrA